MGAPNASSRSPGPAPAGWAPGPPAPELATEEIHVWLVELDRSGDEVLAWLSPAERARAKRILAQPAAARWARSRALLRGLLGLYLHADPVKLTLAEEKHGKPYLAEPDGRAPAAAPCFSLSHSAHLALIALAHQPLGVDLELDRRALDEPALAARALSPEHAERLASLPPARRRREFLRLWARHEAMAKWRGTGIWSAATPAPGWVVDLEPPQGAAALATAAAPRSVRCWSLVAGATPWPSTDRG